MGCGQEQHSVVGMWSWENPVADTDVGYRFNADGTYQFWYRGNQARTMEEGTYILEGNELTLVPDDKGTPTTSGTIKWMTSKRFEYKNTKGTTVWTKQDP